MQGCIDKDRREKDDEVCHGVTYNDETCGQDDEREDGVRDKEQH